MKCKYKEFFTGNGECDLSYPSCTVAVLCVYEDRYHERMTEAKIAERENYVRDNCEDE